MKVANFFDAAVKLALKIKDETKGDWLIENIVYHSIVYFSFTSNWINVLT